MTCTQCGKAFSAWDDLVGKTVQCPKCQQKMVVPSANPVSPAERSGPERSGAAGRAGQGAGAGSGQPGARSGSSPAGSMGLPPTRSAGPTRNVDRADRAESPATVARPIANPARRPAAAPPKGSSASSATGRSSLPKRPVVEEDMDDSDELPHGCPNCNAPMPRDEDLCDACGYHRILKKVLDMDGIHRPKTATGFERLIAPQLTEGETVTNLLLWLKIAGFFVLAFILFLIIGTPGPVLVLLAAGGYFAYRWWRATQAAEAEDRDGEPDVNRDPVSIFLWTLWLWWNRTMGWRSPTAPYAPLRSLTLRDPQFSDVDLRESDEIANYEVLDLEGTGITDNGIHFLATQKQLRFVVLRRTKVTAAGLQRLQQALPDATLWL